MIKTREELKKFRKAQGLTQSQFAKKYGASYITIMRLETGITPMETSYTVKNINMSIETDFDAIKNALTAYGLSIDDIEAILMCYELRKKLLDNYSQ